MEVKKGLGKHLKNEDSDNEVKSIVFRVSKTSINLCQSKDHSASETTVTNSLLYQAKPRQHERHYAFLHIQKDIEICLALPFCAKSTPPHSILPQMT